MWGLNNVQLGGLSATARVREERGYLMEKEKMKFGKGELVKLDGDDPESRTVRACVKRDGSLYLLEITRPVVESPEEAQQAAENCCKIVDGRMVTAILVSPECFNGILQAGIQLVQRIMDAPEETRYTAPEASYPAT